MWFYSRWRMKSNMRRKIDVQKHLEKITFRKMLTISMVLFVCILFLVFSLIVTNLSEKKIRENVKDNMSMVVKQFDVYLNNYIANIYTGFLNLEANQNLYQLRTMKDGEQRISYAASNYVYLKNLLNQFLNANSTSVYNVYLNFGDGKITTQAYEKNLLKINYSYEQWKARFPDNRYYWVDADSCRDLIPDKEVGAMLFRLYENIDGNPSGMILIALKQQFFEDILDVTSLDQKAALSILTDYGTMHFGEMEAWDIVKDRHRYLMDQESKEYDISTEILDGYYFMYKPISYTGWKLVYNVEENSISNAHYIMRDVIILTAVAVACAAVLMGLLSGAIGYPLRELAKKVDSDEILEKEIDVHSYAEITTLSRNLEKMRCHINRLLKQVESEQEAKRKMEIALLQEQINPHFLYNTLYSISQLCELKKTEKAGEMLIALATFYRIGLSKGNSIITVKEELKHVENYLFIQHFRYSDLFDYTIDCDEEILDCMIPKMSLQPLVENAIYHGIKQKHSFGNICILGGTHNGTDAYLEVHDDGPQIDGQKLGELKEYLNSGVLGSKDTSFGMRNVNSRIQLEFGRESGLEIESSQQDTCVRICFRMKRKNEQIE